VAGNDRALQLRLDEGTRSRAVADARIGVSRRRRLRQQGSNGRWRENLSREDAEKYERLAGTNLNADCARWLETSEI